MPAAFAPTSSRTRAGSRIGPDDEARPGLVKISPNRRDNLFTIRVDDCRATYDLLRARGAVFLTDPVSHGGETRCFFRDLDGHLFEISEYRPAR